MRDAWELRAGFRAVVPFGLTGLDTFGAE